MKSLVLYFLILKSLFKFSLSQCVLGEVANNSSECLRKAVNGTFCCYLTPLEDKYLNSICFPYKVTKYLGNLQIHYNQITYNIDCGLGSTFMDSYWNLTVEDRYMCGVENPKNEKECHDNSTKSNTCCYYEGNGLANCYWLGVKYQARLNSNGYLFSCQSKYLQNKKQVLFYKLFLLIISVLV